MLETKELIYAQDESAEGTEDAAEDKEKEGETEDKSE